jgi:MurNAc alpha-1-phosphate uridylyltransferase
MLPPSSITATDSVLSGSHVAATSNVTPAIVLAAGRGERMRPLTDTTPKPLLHVQGQPLLAWHVHALVAGGFQQLVVNTAWLGHEIPLFFDAYRFSDGTYSLSTFSNAYETDHPADTPAPSIKRAATAFTAAFSNEQADFGGALETAGGIARALPLLGAHQPPHTQDVFWVVAGDVFVPGFAFTQASVDRFRASTALAHLWLVPNPPHNPQGDFGLSDASLALNLPKPILKAGDTPAATDQPRYTYSTIGLYRAELFNPPWCDIPAGNPNGTKAPLAPLLRQAMDAGRVSAELYTGPWTDVGTPERLAELNAI